MNSSEITGLIYKIATHFYGADLEDLFQAGALGVVKAYEKYKEDGNTKFSTYAYDYIFGEMYAFVHSERQIKVNRGTLRLCKSIEMARYSLAQKWNRIPSNEELAIYLDKDIRIIENAIQAGSIIVSSLDKASNEERSVYETIPSQEKISVDEKLALQESMESLEEEERKIIKYRYFNDLTQSEIARKLNMTQVMVSRYEKRGLNKMKSLYLHM